MPKKTLRVVIPRNPGDLLDLSVKIYNKHQAEGTKSPLNTLQDYNWSDIGPNVQLAQQKHNEAEDLRKAMEKAYAERDKYMGPVDGVVKASRDLLLSVNAKNPKKLGDYGFEVNDTPKPKKDDGNKPT